MEIKATLEKPYSETQRLDFIVENNHNQGFEIKETEEQLQAWGYSDEETAEQKQQTEQLRKSKLKMTKRDFFLYVVQPFGVKYSDLMQIISNNDTILACYEGCNHIYRYDEMLVGNIKPILETLTEQEIDEKGLTQMLDDAFETHNAKD